MSSASGYMGAKYFQEFGPRFLDMSYCQKGSHLQRGVDFCCQTGLHRGVIIMKSRVANRKPSTPCKGEGSTHGQEPDGQGLNGRSKSQRD